MSFTTESLRYDWQKEFLKTVKQRNNFTYYWLYSRKHIGKTYFGKVLEQNFGAERILIDNLDNAWKLEFHRIIFIFSSEPPLEEFIQQMKQHSYELIIEYLAC
jgi:hypothetical protein